MYKKIDTSDLIFECEEQLRGDCVSPREFETRRVWEIEGASVEELLENLGYGSCNVKRNKNSVISEYIRENKSWAYGKAEKRTVEDALSQVFGGFYFDKQALAQNIN